MGDADDPSFEVPLKTKTDLSTCAHSGDSPSIPDERFNLCRAKEHGLISTQHPESIGVSGTAAAPSGIAIDHSGNVGIANPTANTVDEIVAAAAPASPLTNAAQTNTPGAKP